MPKGRPRQKWEATSPRPLWPPSTMWLKYTGRRIHLLTYVFRQVYHRQRLKQSRLHGRQGNEVWARKRVVSGDVVLLSNMTRESIATIALHQIIFTHSHINARWLAWLLRLASLSILSLSEASTRDSRMAGTCRNWIARIAITTHQAATNDWRLVLPSPVCPSVCLSLCL